MSPSPNRIAGWAPGVEHSEYDDDEMRFWLDREIRGTFRKVSGGRYASA